MAVTVIVETGAQIANSNSYVSIATIDAWALTNPHDDTWSDLTDAQKNGYAVMSCRVLNEQMDWDGWQTDDEQSLDLPRSGMTDKNGNSIDDDEIPSEIQNAQSELARLLAENDRTADADTAGFSEISVGSIKLGINPSDRPSVLASAVWNQISAFGVKANPKGILQVVRT
jgi:hypothetical protein